MSGVIVEPPVLDHYDGVAVFDSRYEEPLGVIRGSRHYHAKPGYVHEHRLQALRVLGGRAPAPADNAAYNERDIQAAAEHVMPLGRVVYYLVERDGKEVGPHVDEYGFHARGGGPYADAGYAVLGKGAVHYAVFAEFFLEALCGAEYAAGVVDAFA
jgi:hypothetical protein